MKHPKFYETTPEVRKRMANVHLKKGKAETMLAKELWHQGVRYRLNFRALPGSPDIALTKHRIAVFVDGEFWHGNNWEERKSRLKSNREYWIEKIEENIQRDRRNDAALSDMGWVVLRFWENDVLKRTDECVDLILASIREKKDILGGSHV